MQTSPSARPAQTRRPPAIGPIAGVRALFGEPAQFRLAGLEALWLGALAILGAAAAVYVAVKPTPTITEFFLIGQDVIVLACLTLAFRLAQLPATALSPGAAGAMTRFAQRWGAQACIGLAVAAAAVGLAGWQWPYHGYPLSLDEFWANFDTQIFRRGRALAEIPAQWRAYVPALQPEWRLESPDNSYWSSTYLPMNAAFRALFTRLGSAALAGPFWAGLSIVLVYAIARTLWPERRDAALAATVLAATSSQLLVAAMSPYAMSAHLALNLAWLWLFLRKGWWAVPLALAAGFAASGLHQLIFHPLFVAPFVLQLWLTRRWGRAAAYTLGYAAICLFWVAYWSLMLKSQGVPPTAAGAMAGGQFVSRVLDLLSKLNPSAIGLMAENLLRFLAWQNPLAVVLALAAAPAAFKAWRTPLAALWAGIVLTILVVGAVLPYQGHGWGYRYLHGYIGGLCLLAGFAWTRLAAPADGPALQRAWASLGVCSLVAVAIALPLRLTQVDRQIAPTARAFQAIRAARAEVVIVDPADMTYGVDLVRNDPFLRDGPKVMDLELLSTAQVQALCAAHSVALFTVADAPQLREPAPTTSAAVRAIEAAKLAKVPGCLGRVSDSGDRSRPPNGF